MKIVYRALMFAVSIIILQSCGGGSANEGADTVQPVGEVNELPGTLIMIGDSIMAGCMDSLDQPNADYTMTTAHLVAQQGVRVINLSRSGNSFRHAEVQRVDGGVNFTQGGNRGTAIWITLGANDFLWGLSNLEEYRTRYLNLLRRIEAVPAQKIFCVTPLISRFDYDHYINVDGVLFEDYRQVIRELAAAEHCTLVDTTGWFTATDMYDQCHLPDTLHLGEEGHRHYTEHLLAEIRGDYSKY